MSSAYWLTILYKYRRKLRFIADAHGRAVGRMIGKRKQEGKEAA